MSRWIVFDQPSADAVHSTCGVQPELRADASEPANLVSAAVKRESAVTVLPGETPGKVLVMRVRHPQASAPTPAATRARNLAPSGVLGLSDSIDMDSEPEPEKPKKWWQRILD